jgi:hypothetical protein
MAQKMKQYVVRFTGFDPKRKKEVKMTRKVKAFDTYHATDVLDEIYGLRSKYVLRRFEIIGGHKPKLSKLALRVAKNAGPEEE